VLGQASFEQGDVASVSLEFMISQELRVSYQADGVDGSSSNESSCFVQRSSA
jgi:hypothetical protein